ncbi:MAG: aminotransferase class IV [Deltaproteobacteria bacterium]
MEKQSTDEKGLDVRRKGMEKRIAYFNGEFIKESDAKISIYDRGFVYGDAAYDVARTYNHKPYHFEKHIDRLYRSLRYLRIDPMLTQQEMLEITLKVSEYNVKFLKSNDDHRMVWRVTRGEGLRGPMSRTIKPTVLVICDEVPWRLFVRHYIEGGHLVMVNTRVEDPQSVDVKGKLHNKLAHVLADLEAQRIDPYATGLLLDMRGCIAEATRANFFMVSKGRLLTPRIWSILPGITRETILELAKELGIETTETDLFVYDLYNADEVFLSASSPFIEPFSKVDTIPLNKPFPGPITKQLISAFSERVGVDIVQQALSNAP